jgi:hypothetical protein
MNSLSLWTGRLVQSAADTRTVAATVQAQGRRTLELATAGRRTGCSSSWLVS